MVQALPTKTSHALTALTLTVWNSRFVCLCVCVHAFSSHHFSHVKGFPPESTGSSFCRGLNMLPGKRTCEYYFLTWGGFYTLSNGQTRMTRPPKPLFQLPKRLLHGATCQSRDRSAGRAAPRVHQDVQRVNTSAEPTR